MGCPKAVAGLILPPEEICTTRSRGGHQCSSRTASWFHLQLLILSGQEQDHFSTRVTWCRDDSSYRDRVLIPSLIEVFTVGNAHPCSSEYRFLHALSSTASSLHPYGNRRVGHVRTLWVCSRGTRLKVPVLPMPVPAHLPSITVNVVQTETIGLEASNWTQASNDRILIIVCKLRVQRIAVRVGQSGHTSTARLLPLGLCRQPITFCTPVYVGFVDIIAKMACFIFTFATTEHLSAGCILVVNRCEFLLFGKSIGRQLRRAMI